MINMYTVDGDSLIATHYCSGQNQPVLKLNAAKSTADQLVFDFVKVTGANTKLTHQRRAAELQQRRQGRRGVELDGEESVCEVVFEREEVTVNPRELSGFG